MRLSQAINDFKDWRGFKVSGKTVVRYDRVLRIFCLCLGDPNVEDITLKQILQYLEDMKRLGWERNTIIIVCLALRKLFEFCNLQGLKCLSESLIPLPRKEFKMPRVATETDYKRILEVIKPTPHYPNSMRNIALVSLIWDSWARAGEIISLNEDDLEFNKDWSGKATIKTEKSRGRRPIRQIFWTPKTGKYLKAWLRKKHDLEERFKFSDTEAVFLSLQKAGPYDSRGKRMTSKGVSEVLRLLSNRARMPYIVNAHSMRHYGGRHIIKSGGSNADISNLLGHSHLDSSMVYSLMEGKDLEERYNKFKGKRSFPKPEFVGALARKVEHSTKGGGKFGRS